MSHTDTAGHLVIEARNATLPDMVEMLKTRRARQLDVVAPSARFSVANGQLVIDGTEASIDPDGVTPAAGSFRPLHMFDRGVAGRFGIPHSWLAWCRDNRPDLYDATVNGILHGGTGADGTQYPPDSRLHLLRCFRGDPGEPGIVRTLLSNGYKPIDHLDILSTALAVIQEQTDAQIRQALRDATGLDFGDETPLTDADRQMFAGLYPDGDVPGIAGGTEIRNLNLTEDTMWLRIAVPGIQASAPVMTDGLRSPFRPGGARRADGWQPPRRPRPRRGDVVELHIDLKNSEVGSGSYQLVPGYTICVCDNGQVAPGHAIKTQHLGSRLEEGEVEWSDETRQAAMRLVMAKTRDALTKFLQPGWLATLVAESEEHAAVPLTDPAETIKVVASKCQFSDVQADEILRMFTLGGQLTVAGVGNAVTAAAQAMPRAEDALDLEYKSLTAMGAAADHQAALVRAAGRQAAA